MLDNVKINELFAVFTGLPDDQLTRWEHLCTGATAALTARLKPDVNTTEHMERLCTTAAAMAYADYLLLEGGSGVGMWEDFKVGDISFKNSSSSSVNREDSAGIKRYFLEQVADLLAYDSFAFLTVPVGEKP